MAYSEQVLHRARARLEQAKAEREQENAAHRADAYARYPRLAEIDNELRHTMAELMAAALQRGEDPSQAVAAVREKNLALQRERNWILEAGDLTNGYLDDTPVCAKCGGRLLCRRADVLVPARAVPAGAEKGADEPARQRPGNV